MNEWIGKPKRFGEVLDQTFRLCKNRFSELFLITLVLFGPIYLLEAIVSLLSGTSFFTVDTTGGFWKSRVTSFFTTPDSVNAGLVVLTIVLGFASMLLYPVAQGAYLVFLGRLKDNASVSPKIAIKQAFSRFWPIIGSYLLFGLIFTGILCVPTVVLVLLISGISALTFTAFPVIGIILGVVLLLAAALFIMLLLTRLSLFLGAVVIDKTAPGLSRSWQLTRKQTWRTFGLFLVVILLTMLVQFAVEGSLILLLGNSVLYSMIIGLVGLILDMVMFVAYSVIYFDLKARYDADDLKEMIANYD
ncbi:MAG TPA: hypothetical protein VFK44_13730 [Bacillales bacterium]|nr:hypothetical protein [Bacillales bacterium]